MRKIDMWPRQYACDRAFARLTGQKILSDPDYDSPIMKAETFAPVLTINRVRRLTFWRNG
eukprot:766360-Hanusia_phi.AAC.3